MSRPRILTLILAGGEGGRLDVLTERRAKPAMPYAGVYRLIDFSLSNCMHSGLTDVWVVEQYEPHSLNEHLANGRPWDLDRTYGGLQVIPPYQNRADGPGEGGFSRGNADAIWRNRHFLREFAPDLILVLSADHVYKLDYRDVLAQHQRLQAEVTMVVTRIAREDAGRFGNVTVDRQDDSRVTGFAYKPEEPVSDLVTTEVFVYDARVLLETLDQLAEERRKESEAKANAQVGKDPAGKGEEEGSDNAGADVALRDFGHDLIPRLVERGRARAFHHKGYWRDVGTLDSYWQGHRDLLESVHPDLQLDARTWPILTYGVQSLPARIEAGASIDASLISPGCLIRGQVVRSVLAPHVIVEEGAVVRDSVILHDTRIAAGAVVTCALVDQGVVIGRDARVGEDLPSAGRQPSADQITVIGASSAIASGRTVPRGARVKPEG